VGLEESLAEADERLCRPDVSSFHDCGAGIGISVHFDGLMRFQDLFNPPVDFLISCITHHIRGP